jgi:hypothetical protein
VSGPSTVTRSLRIVRLQALAPRLLVSTALVVLCVAGLRAIVAAPRTLPPPPSAPAPRQQDLGAEAFAQSFVRSYLTWDAADLAARSSSLRGFLNSGLDEDAGLTPADGTSQSVRSTEVLGTHGSGGELAVTVAAQTSAGTTYLTVPVLRDQRGFLSIAGYPALVGPPATDLNTEPPQGQDVEDTALQAVVTRAVTNYLAGERRNLLADLTPDAVVSLPPRPMRVTSTDRIAWVQTGKRVAVDVVAQDAEKSSWTLGYELDVRKNDRWYVRSIQVDPTFQGGS